MRRPGACASDPPLSGGSPITAKSLENAATFYLERYPSTAEACAAS
jgi:hypothetical protein